MKNPIKSLWNLPSVLWDSIFPPKIQRIHQLVVVSADRELLKKSTKLLGPNKQIVITHKQRVIIKNRPFYLDKNEMAVITTRYRRWGLPPAVSVAILSE